MKLGSLSVVSFITAGFFKCCLLLLWVGHLSRSIQILWGLSGDIATLSTSAPTITITICWSRRSSWSATSAPNIIITTCWTRRSWWSACACWCSCCIAYDIMTPCGFHFTIVTVVRRRVAVAYGSRQINTVLGARTVARRATMTGQAWRTMVFTTRLSVSHCLSLYVQLRQWGCLVDRVEFDGTSCGSE